MNTIRLDEDGEWWMRIYPCTPSLGCAYRFGRYPTERCNSLYGQMFSDSPKARRAIYPCS